MLPISSCHCLLLYLDWCKSTPSWTSGEDVVEPTKYPPGFRWELMFVNRVFKSSGRRCSITSHAVIRSNWADFPSTKILNGLLMSQVNRLRPPRAGQFARWFLRE